MKLILILLIFYINLYSNIKEDKLDYEIIEKKAKKGYSKYQYEMYKIYRYGEYSKKIRKEKSFKWLKRSASNNNIKSINKLASIFFNASFYIKKADIYSSYYWYKRGCSLKDSYSCLKVSTFYENGLLVGKDFNKFIYYVNLSIKYGSQDAIEFKHIILNKQQIKLEKKNLYIK